LDDPDSKDSQYLANSSPGFADTWRQKLKNQLRLATQRKLPPSCLRCGMREVSYFKEGEWAPHPGTGEEVRFSCSGMCSTDFAVKFYNLDGELLPLSDDEKSNYLDAVSHPS
jgi:hypothetical protein